MPPQPSARQQAQDTIPVLPPLPGTGLRRRPSHQVLRRRRLALFAGAAAALLLLTGGGIAVAQVLAPDASPAAAPTPAPVATPTPTPTPEPTPTPTPTPTPEPEPEQPDYDVDSPSSITVVVNKMRPFDPIGWAPDDLVMPEGIENTNGQPLRAEAATALQNMHAEAVAAGVPFFITSAYRPYDMQVGLFDSYVARDGLEAAETYSARAGHSEHQTGLAVDLDDGAGCAFQSCFGETASGIWLRDNAYRFGYILRYNDGEEPVVGYIYEPWHFRYVGVDIATDMHESGEKNLETYLGLDAAPDYPEGLY
ncbi:M15 family metallopeptidase [Leucobacter sp. GX24907]